MASTFVKISFNNIILPIFGGHLQIFHLKLWIFTVNEKETEFFKML